MSIANYTDDLANKLEKIKGNIKAPYLESSEEDWSRYIETMSTIGFVVQEMREIAEKLRH
jgi:hypothetical protein